MLRLTKTCRVAARALTWLASTEEEAESLAVGGQAVMEGVMMRNDERLAIAVRRSDEVIIAVNRPWFTFSFLAPLRRPFLRGFPVLIETLINGIKALNFSAEVSIESEGEELSAWQLALTLFVAITFAVLLFVVLPHAVTIGMNWLGLASGLKGLSFHLWDGFFKASIFLGYILAISRLPDIRRVFEYHGAEHKVIWAYESRMSEITPATAGQQSRLHPRCGTTFMLFVMAISILLHAILVPVLLNFWNPENKIIEHAGTICFKLLLIAPISCLAYEAIRYAAKIQSGLLATCLRTPGLMLQKLTTREPDATQLEVAMVALYEALGNESAVPIRVPLYSQLETVDVCKT